MRLELPVEAVSRSEAVTLVLAPGGIAPKTIVSEMQNRWDITMAGALGRFKDRAFRVGHIGFITLLDVVAAMFALEATLNHHGWVVEPGASARAIYQYMQENNTDDLQLS